MFDIARPKFGVEHEFFILYEGCPPLPGQLDSFWADLASVEMADESFKSSIGNGFPVILRVPGGYVEVKPESYSHILELAFSPYSDLDLFRKAFEETIQVVEEILLGLGISLGEGAFFVPSSEDMLFSQCSSAEQSARLARLVSRPIQDLPFAFKHVMGTVCSTQIHFEIPIDLFFTRLKRLYRLQYLIPLIFSNSFVKGDTQAHCARPIVLRDSIQDEYWPPHTIPRSIPQDDQALRDILRRPNQRDYSFLARHRLGTIEYRTSDSLPNLDTILSMTALQAAITHGALFDKPIFDANPHDLFWKVCEQGRVSIEILESDIELLSPFASLMESGLKPYLLKALDELVLLTKAPNSR